MLSEFLRLVLGGPRLPADRRPPLDPDERVVAWAAVSDAQTVVATNRGLWLPDGAERLGWHMIHKAVWSGRELTVTPAEVVEERTGFTVVADRPPRTVVLLDPDRVPEQVRARVTGSVAYTGHHPMPDGESGPVGPAGPPAGPRGRASGGVRIAARRVSGVDGLTWTVRADQGTDLDSPAARETLDELVARAWAQIPGVR